MARTCRPGPVRDPAADLREDPLGLRRRLVRRALGGAESTCQGHEAHEREDGRERHRADPLVPALTVASADCPLECVIGRLEASEAAL